MVALFCVISLFVFFILSTWFFVFLQSSGEVCNTQICNIKIISSSSLKLFLMHEFFLEVSIVYVKCMCIAVIEILNAFNMVWAWGFS